MWYIKTKSEKPKKPEKVMHVEEQISILALIMRLQRRLRDDPISPREQDELVRCIRLSRLKSWEELSQMEKDDALLMQSHIFQESIKEDRLIKGTESNEHRGSEEST